MPTLLLPTARRCTSCGARTRWVTSGDNPVLIDADPTPDGNLVLVLDPDGWVAERRRGYRASALRDQGHDLFRYHRCT